LRMKLKYKLSVRLYTTVFQFLWGWNPSGVTPWGVESYRDFQFLWGWNRDEFSALYVNDTTSAFNSFEDETYFYEKNKRDEEDAFNSFEDETGVYVYPSSLDQLNFQFLWGWN